MMVMMMAMTPSEKASNRALLMGCLFMPRWCGKRMQGAMDDRRQVAPVRNPGIAHAPPGLRRGHTRWLRGSELLVPRLGALQRWARRQPPDIRGELGTLGQQL